MQVLENPSNELPYPFCVTFQRVSSAGSGVVQPRMVLVHGNYVHVQVKNDLPRCFAVVLDDSNAFRVYCLLHGVSHFLNDRVQVCCFFLWNLVDVLVMLLWNNERVTDVYGLYAHERNYFFVLVDYACRRFFSRYFAECTRFGHGNSSFTSPQGWGSLVLRQQSAAISLKEVFCQYSVMDTLVDDIGSFPLPAEVDRETFEKAYQLAREAIVDRRDIRKDDFLLKNFCKVTLDSFRIKLASGLDVITYPQQYDGVRQVGDVIHVAMTDGSFVVEEKQAFLPEVHLISEEAKTLSEEFGKRIPLRVSLFGPLEQYLTEVGTAPYSDVLESFAETIRRFAKNSILNSKHVKTEVVSIDEPSFGFQSIAAESDLICDVLEKAFDFQGAVRQIHLHSASRLPDLLEVGNIDVLSFEYAASPKNIAGVSRNLLEGADKQVRVGVSRTDIDSIVAELYDRGVTKPTAEQLVDEEEIIKKRYVAAKEKYGDRMTFTGPDCGLGSWPSQEAAQLLLKRTVKAIKK